MVATEHACGGIGGAPFIAGALLRVGSSLQILQQGDCALNLDGGGWGLRVWVEGR